MTQSWILDIETTLDWKEIRYVGIFRRGEGFKRGTVSGEALQYWYDTLPPDSEIWTWNGSRFDAPRLEEIWGVDINARKGVKHYDGMLLAKMLLPELSSYSMENMLKYFKIEDKKGKVDYDKDTLEVISDYCYQDLKLTNQILAKLIAMAGTHKWRKALDVETRVAYLCEQQVQKRVRFDTEKAAKLVHALKTQMSMLAEDILRDIPELPIPEGKLHHPPKVQFKKDGTLSFHLLNYLAKYDYEVDPEVPNWVRPRGKRGICYMLPLKSPLVTHQVPSLTNQTQLKNYLLELGWKPTMWNYSKTTRLKTSPRLTDKQTKEVCSDLLRMDIPWVKDLSKWLTCSSRLNVIQSDKGTGWLPQAYEWNHKTSEASLPSDADTYGANTARWTHRGIANVPRVSSPYGREMRELFCAREGKVWVGWDASSLEACIEAHYTYKIDPEYSAELMDGDVHTKNLSIVPALRDRDHAKTFKYGITYGAQAKKVADILGVSDAEGKKWFDAFWEGNTALRELKRDLKAVCSRGGYFNGLDGRPIFVRSEHSQLNALFQSGGAIVMKYAMLIADARIKSEFPDAYGLIRYHDEEIWECEPHQAERVGEIGCASIRAAAKYLKLNVELDAEYKIGQNWAEVH